MRARTLLLSLAGVLCACTSTVPGQATPPGAGGAAGPGELEFTRDGGCGEVTIWAATEEADRAFRVTVDVSDRSTVAPTTYDVDLRDPTVIAQLLTGSNLTDNFCTDVIDSASQPTDVAEVTTGTGELVVDPPEGGEDCVHAELTLTGVVASDGTRIGDITMETDFAGCHVGG
ncbi:hypothetical protein [Blastococcus sp. SYSU D00820]